jgi:hypothetical protein
MAQTTEGSQALFKVEPFESDESVRFESLSDLGDVEPGPFIASGTTRGAAIPELPARSYGTTRGAATLEDGLANIEAWKQAELARVQREYHETKAKAAEVRQRHYVKSLGTRRRVPRGPSRERRPGPCRIGGSRRSRPTSRARSPGDLAGDPDPPPRQLAASSRAYRAELGEYKGGDC